MKNVGMHNFSSLSDFFFKMSTTENGDGGERIKAYTILILISYGQRPFGMCKYRLDDDIKVDLEE
jgi:hypothetical protein